MSKVGIYMPAWNVEKYLKESIDSIQKQKFKNWQLVIIDDNSSDNTFEIAKEAASKDSRIIVKHREEHSGKIGAIKNEAISYLDDSEYICHVGSDDLIPDYCFSAFTETLDKHKEFGAACGSFLAFDDTGRQWKFPHVERDQGFSSERLMKYMCVYPMRFYRRKVVESVGGYSNELTSAVDYDLALKLDEVTKILRIQNPPTYFYRQHGEQVSTKNRDEQNQNAKTALENAIKRRGLNLIIQNDRPPFITSDKYSEHFIWGK